MTQYDDNGARHLATGPRLGALRDEDADGPPTLGADGDDLLALGDEDGVMFGAIAPGLQSSSITIDLQNASFAYVDAWIDFNGNGTFDDNEKILDSVGVLSGTNVLSYDAAAFAVPGETYARVRLSSQGGLGPAGFAADGEVEDYLVTIRERVSLDLSTTANHIEIRSNQDDLEVFNVNDGTLLFAQPIESLYSLTVQGSPAEVDLVDVNFGAAFGGFGFFSLPGGIELHGGGTAGDRMQVLGSGQTRAEYSTSVSPAGQPRLDLHDGTDSQTLRFDGFGDLTFRDLLTFDAHSVLNVGSHTYRIESTLPTNLSNLTLLDGGQLIGNTLALGSGESIVGRGSIDARLSGELGSLIQLTGDLSIGDSSSVAGFVTRGDIEVGPHTLTLLDANQAVLGSLTTLGESGTPGTIIAVNGLLVDLGQNVVGYGTIVTSSDPLKPFIVNGSIAGNSAAEPITFSGSYLKGVGTLDHFVLTGGASFNPGFSPAAVNVGSGTYTADSALIVELGGTLAGSQYDQVNHWGDATLGGTLDVQFIDGFVPTYGSTFDIMTFAGTRTGEFVFAGLPFTTGSSAEAVLIADYQNDKLRLVTTGPGDANLDGRVNFLDFLVLQNGFGSSEGWTAGDFDFSGTVDFLDFLILQNHFGNLYFEVPGKRLNNDLWTTAWMEQAPGSDSGVRGQMPNPSDAMSPDAIASAHDNVEPTRSPATAWPSQPQSFDAGVFSRTSTHADKEEDLMQRALDRAFADWEF